MADRKLTLFEIHLDDATFTANATATEGGDDPDEAEAAAGDDDETAGCPAKRAGKALLALAVLAVLALAVGRLLGEDLTDEDLDALADLDAE